MFGEGGTVERVLESGQKEKDWLMNAMQLMNGIFNIFTYLDVKVIRDIWENTNIQLQKNEPFQVITNPVLTRWWLVGCTACDLDKFWDIWQLMMVGLIKMPRSKTDKKYSGNVIRGIAAANKNLMGFPAIQGDVKFIAGIHTYFVFPHFSFFQQGDWATHNKAGYQVCLTLERYFIMVVDLDHCDNNRWKTINEFENCVNFMETRLNENEKEKLNKKAMHTFRIMNESITKHFGQWANSNLPFSLFSSQPTAQMVAQVIIEELHGISFPMLSQPELLYKSSLQNGRAICLSEYKVFVKRECSIDKTYLQNHKAIRGFEKQILLIANGADMWDRENHIEELRLYHLFFLVKLSGLPTNTQMTKRSVKKSNNVDVLNRNDQTRASYAMANHHLIDRTAEKKTCRNDETMEYFDRTKDRSKSIVSQTMQIKRDSAIAKENITV